MGISKTMPIIPLLPRKQEQIKGAWVRESPKYLYGFTNIYDLFEWKLPVMWQQKL